MTRYISTIFLVLWLSAGFGQNETDVLRYSTTDVFGSARFEGMAGSFGALGADISAIQINPAGMGRFSSSKIDFRFNNAFLRNHSTYNGTNLSAQDNKFVLGSLGIVTTKDRSRDNNRWRYTQFTFAYTRLKNFAHTKRYEGQNFHSLLDIFAADGYGIPPEEILGARPFTTALGYETYALDYDYASSEYYSLLTAGDMYHHREIKTNGGIGEFHLGYSGNYANRFYFGASIGLRRVKYMEDVVHQEELLDTVGTPLRSFEYLYGQESKGYGLNLKLGVLYLPVDQFRIGLAFETPTIIRMTDKWSAAMNATFFDGTESISSQNIPVGEFNYRVQTPMKIRSSFAYILGMRGAINVDFELARLPGGKLKSHNTAEHPGNAYQFDVENAEVKNQFRTILNTRIGMEYMIFNDFYLRGGVAVLPQPYRKEITNLHRPNYTISGGIGWESKAFYIDFSYRLLKIQEEYYAFDPSQIENRVDFKTNMHAIVLSGGMRF